MTICINDNIKSPFCSKTIYIHICRDTICNPSPKCMKSWPSKPSTINL